jgi:hypothetical protein
MFPTKHPALQNSSSNQIELYLRCQIGGQQCEKVEDKTQFAFPQAKFTHRLEHFRWCQFPKLNH